MNRNRRVKIGGRGNLREGPRRWTAPLQSDDAAVLMIGLAPRPLNRNAEVLKCDARFKPRRGGPRRYQHTAPMQKEHTDFDHYLTGPAKHYRRLALGISTAIQIPPERLAQEAKPRDPIIVQFGQSDGPGFHFHRAWLPRAMLAGGIDIGWAMRSLLRDYPNQPDFQRNKRPSLRHLLYPGVGCGAGLPMAVLSRESDYKTPTDRHTIYTELYLGWAPGMQEAAALPDLLTPYRTFWEGAPITTTGYSYWTDSHHTDINTGWANTYTIDYHLQCLYHTLAPKDSTHFVAEARSQYRSPHPLYQEQMPAWYTRKSRQGWLRYFNRLGGVTWLPVWDFQLVSDAPEAAVELEWLAPADPAAQSGFSCQCLLPPGDEAMAAEDIRRTLVATIGISATQGSGEILADHRVAVSEVELAAGSGPVATLRGRLYGPLLLEQGWDGQ